MIWNSLGSFHAMWGMRKIPELHSQNSVFCQHFTYAMWYKMHFASLKFIALQAARKKGDLGDSNPHLEFSLKTSPKVWNKTGWLGNAFRDVGSFQPIFWSDLTSFFPAASSHMRIRMWKGLAFPFWFYASCWCTLWNQRFFYLIF